MYSPAAGHAGIVEEMDIIEDLEAVRRRIDSEPWAAKLVRSAREEADMWISNFHDSPSRVSGWGHDYICRACNSPLVFDMSKVHFFDKDTEKTIV